MARKQFEWKSWVKNINDLKRRKGRLRKRSHYVPLAHELIDVRVELFAEVLKVAQNNPIYSCV